MINQELRRLLQTKGMNPEQFEIPNSVFNEGVQYQLRLIKNSYLSGNNSLAIVYSDQLDIEKALSQIKSTMEDMVRCVDFSYAQTMEKKKTKGALDAPLRNHPTSGLLEHLFEAEETDFNQPTLILYHSFEGIPRGIARLIKGEQLKIGDEDIEQIKAMNRYLDGGCGRGWTHAHGYMKSQRLSKLLGIEPLIRTAVVFSIDEMVANNWYNTHYPSGSRTQIGIDFRKRYIF